MGRGVVSWAELDARFGACDKRAALRMGMSCMPAFGVGGCARQCVW